MEAKSNIPILVYFYKQPLLAFRGQTGTVSKKMKSTKVVSFDNFVSLHFFASGLRLASRGHKTLFTKMYLCKQPLLATGGQTEAASKKMRSTKVVGFDVFNNFVTLHFFARGLRLAY